MLDQGHSSGTLTGEDRRMAKKFKNAARQAFIGMQTPVTKRNGKKHQKLMQGEGFIKLKKSKKGLSGKTLSNDYPTYFPVCYRVLNYG